MKVAGGLVETSVSELLAWRHCQRMWRFRYRDELAPKNRNPFMASGTAVHAAIEAGLRSFGSGPDRALTAMEAGPQLLANEFKHHEYADEQIAKFTDGVLRALRKVPMWVWEGRDWEVEYPLVYRTGVVARGEDWAVKVNMRPDIYRVDGKVVELLEVKTTETTPSDFLLHSPQWRMYGLALAQKYPDHLITCRYMCVSTDRGGGSTELSWPFGDRMLEATARSVQALVVDMLAHEGWPIVANEGWHCKFCDYAQLCTTIITGGEIGEQVRNMYMSVGRKALTEFMEE